MDHHLVLILAELLDWVALTGVAVKGQNREFLEKFTFQYPRIGGSWVYRWLWL